MLKSIVVAAVLAVPALAAASPAGPQQPAAQTSPANIRVAQACGWYAIMLCSRSRSEAARWSDNHGVGRVVNTSSDNYPNFAPGYFCVVEGPMSQGRAQATANGYRGISRQAYIKNAC